MVLMRCCACCWRRAAGGVSSKAGSCCCAFLLLAHLLLITPSGSAARQPQRVSGGVRPAIAPRRTAEGWRAAALLVASGTIQLRGGGARGRNRAVAASLAVAAAGGGCYFLFRSPPRTLLARPSGVASGTLRARQSRRRQ